MNRPVTTTDHGVEYAALSDVGLVRAKNQDSLAVAMAGSERAWQERGHLFVVADGMGAHAAGELASQLAADTLPLVYQKYRRHAPPEALLRAMHEANARIYRRGEANDEFRGMGTTLTALALLPQGALVAHVGDSRAYRLRGDCLEQLTFDHSLVWEVCQAEGITEEEVPAYIPRNVITRSVGSRQEVEIDLEGPFPVDQDDIFLLCSDGLNSLVNDRQIGTILGALPPAEAAQALVDMAITRGGSDNISAVVVRCRQAAAGATRVAGTGPLEWSPVHWLWPPLAAAALGLAGWFLSGVEAAVAAALAGAIGVGGATAVGRWRAGRPWYRRSDGQPFGKGPYTRCLCPLDDQATGLFAKTVGDLRSLAQREAWNIDWPAFDAFAARAEEALQSGRFAQAVREHCGAISFLVRQVRAAREAAQNARNGGELTIE